MRIRQATASDAAAIARIHREGAAYYVGLAPELFRMPDDDGLIEFVEPGPGDNNTRTLYTVAERDRLRGGGLGGLGRMPASDRGAKWLAWLLAQVGDEIDQRGEDGRAQPLRDAAAS